MKNLSQAFTKRLAVIGLATMTLASLSSPASANSFRLTPIQTPISGGFQKTPGSSLGPKLSQLGSSSAYVPMKRKQVGLVNGNEISNHVLATTNGNLNMKVRLSMTCPTGKKVTHLSYRPQGQNFKTLVNAPTASSSYSKDLLIQPFSLQDLEKAGQDAFGGAWAAPNGPKNKMKTVTKTLKKSVLVRGQCEGWANKQSKVFPVLLKTTFDDLDFFVPIP